MPRHDRHSRPHSWQSGRWLPSLDAATFRVDERGPIDLIAFATAFSKLLVYRGETGEGGNWDAFFIGDLRRLIPGDVSFLIAKIASFDAKREYLEVVGPSGQEPAGLLNAIYKALRRLDDWRQNLALAKSGKSDKSVEQTLSATLESLIAGDYTFGTSNLPELVAYLGNSDFAAQWSLLVASEGPLGDIWTSKTPDPDQNSVKHDLLHIYGLFNRTMRVMSDQAARLLEASLGQANHAPHAALLLTFLTLYARVQADLNKMTGRHLNFYFRKVLRLSERGSSPDRAHVYFELAPDAAPFVLPAGTQLSAGVDAVGAPIVFALDDDLALNRARVASLASLYIRRAPDDGSIMAILARPVANSQDGFGANLANPDAGWSAFGAGNDPGPLSPENAIYAEIGLLIRSPCLLLRAGLRRLTVTLQFQPSAPLQESVARYLAATRREMMGPAARSISDEQIVQSAFRLALEGTGDDRVIAAGVDLSELASGRLAFIVTLGLDAPPLAPPALSNGLATPAGLPGLRITINPSADARVFAYSFFEGLKLQAVLLEVAVKGLGPLMVQTLGGPIDASKPFLPFGPFAPSGAAMIFSHPDLFGKALDTLTLNTQWSGLPIPPETLESVYAAYGGQLKNDSFRGCLSRLSNYAWAPLPLAGVAADAPPTFALFDSDANGMVQSASRSFRVDTAAYAPLDQAAAVYNPTCRAGFFRLQLTDPPIGFGQQVYPQILTSTMMANAHASTQKPKPAPPAPVSPSIAALSLDYTAHAELILQGPSTAADPTREQGVYRFGPFGMLTDNVNFVAFPTWPDDGYLLVGIDGLSGSGDVTLLFDVEASAADFSTIARDQAAEATGKTDLTLRYFAGMDWKDMPARAVTQDTTEALSRSGVLRLQFPVDASPFPAPAAGDLTWLQICVTRPERYGRIIDIRCHGATAARVTPLGANVSGAILPPKSISALVQKNPKVLVVGQPFATEGGLLAEDEKQFHIRVSERLRHKQRATLPRDYESLIVDRFPGIGDAKCLTRDEAKWFGAKVGEVVIVVAPLRLPGAASQEPRVPEYLLREIGAYLLDKCPASVAKISIRNPEYEAIRISAWLDFTPGDRAQFLDRVRRTADHFIAPWRDDPTAPLPIGRGQVDLAHLRAVLEDLSFVREVSGLSIVQFYRDPAPQSPGAFEPRTFIRISDTATVRFEQRALAPWWPWSVLSPAPDHQFNLMGAPTGIGVLGVENDFVVASAEGDSFRPPERAGIGNLEVGVDLLVQAGIGNVAIEDDFPVG